MRGLLLKDIYTMCKKTNFLLLMILFFALLPGASVSAFAIFYSVMLPMSALAYDEQSKWPLLAAMMPYSAKALVGSKYLLGWLAVLITTLIAWLGNMFTAGSLAPAALLASLTDGEYLFYILLMLCLALCFLMLNLSLMFWLGVEKGRLFNLLALLLIIGTVSFFADDIMLWLNNLAALENWQFMLFLPAAAAVIAGSLLSMALSVRLYKRRSLRGQL